MMTEEQYWLAKVAEEAAEVAQAALKCAQFGLDHCQSAEHESNRAHLQRELIDLMVVAGMSGALDGGLTDKEVDQHELKKQEKIEKYLTISKELGHTK